MKVAFLLVMVLLFVVAPSIPASNIFKSYYFLYFLHEHFLAFHNFRALRSYNAMRRVQSTLLSSLQRKGSVDAINCEAYATMQFVQAL